MKTLNTVFLGQNQGVIGEWWWTPQGWLFYPLSTQLAQVSQRTMFYTVGDTVTGDILSVKVEIAGTVRYWGQEAQVGQEFEVLVDARYQSSSPKHTRMDLTVYKPSGDSFMESDSDNWPYENPDTTIHFRITGFLGEAFNIDEAGIWQAKLSYVLV